MAEQLEKAQRVCEHVGPSEQTSELWAEAVAFADAWSRYLITDRQMYQRALKAGYTREQWAAVQQGDPTDDGDR